MSDAGGTATRRTATFLFTDIVGSTERWEHDAVDMRVALDRHDRLLRASIETCGGEVFKSVGDALHAVFPTATAAVEAAVDGLRALSTEDWNGEPIAVRMAVYTGEAEAVNGDWLGRPLNRCARLLAASNGGQILVSHTTARLAEADLAAGVHLVGLGAYRFRGVDRAEEVFQVVAPGLASVFGPLTGCEPPDPSACRRLDVVCSGRAGVAFFAGRACRADVGRTQRRARDPAFRVAATHHRAVSERCSSRATPAPARPPSPPSLPRKQNRTGHGCCTDTAKKTRSFRIAPSPRRSINWSRRAEAACSPNTRPITVVISVRWCRS